MLILLRGHEPDVKDIPAIVHQQKGKCICRYLEHSATCDSRTQFNGMIILDRNDLPVMF